MKQITIILLALLLTINLSAQTADATEGCAPLTVNFTAPNATSYFWNFDDGASSVEQNPENIFTVAGTYKVQLFGTQGGTLVGEINITVYPEIQVTINQDEDFGCIPLAVNFSSNIQADPAIDIENITWTFGDGNTGIGSSPMTTYELGGVFDVSLELQTNFLQCNKTVIFEDVIEAEDLLTELVFPDEIPCTEPSTFTIGAGVAQDPRYTYEWDFGNGQTSSSYDSGEVSYANFGTYEVSLTISSPSGCTVTSVGEVVIGPAVADLEYPTKVCAGEPFTIINRTLANRFDWRYGEPLMREFERNLQLTFEEPGVQVITLLSSSVSGCVRETIIEIEVELPDPLFTIDPLFSCSELDPRTLTANDPNLAEYTWNNMSGGSTFVLPGLSEPRDPLHINQADSIDITLEVTSAAGCKADTTLSFDFRLTEAYYIPDRTLGFLTLDVNFSDFSESSHDIVRRFWIYDDGTTAELDPNTTEHVHTYECGTYFPRLVIEDSFGCIDTSKAVEINVICPGDPGGGGGPSGDPDPNDGPVPSGGPDSLCVNDILTFVTPPSGYQYHLYADDNRLSHCWEDSVFTHQFKFPGVFPSSLLVEYEGLLVNEFDFPDIEIFGARAEILYEKDCSNNNTVEFTSNSLNAESLVWSYDGNIISTEASFIYTFDEPGEHMVTLNVTSGPGGCAPDEDVVTIYVPELKADFELPVNPICDSEPYVLDASPSNDVFSTCHKGYKWIFENQRPRETGEPQLEHEFLRGPQDITLVVEDINGCRDSITKRTTIYGVDALYNIDSTICLPYDKDFLDESISDTTLVNWEWSFGSDEQNPSYSFDEGDLNPDKEDTLTITFIAEDILGCNDTLVQDVRIVDPNFFINSQTGSRVCVGEEVLFNAIDTADIKDFYNFYWEVDGMIQDTGFQVALRFDDPGLVTVTLVAEHKNGLCSRRVDRDMTVLESPQAGFTSDVDDVNIICYPAQISFTSDPSLSPNEYDFEWRFGDEDFSEIPNPTIEFGVGTHKVTQIISNSDGCKDSISMFYTLVGPTGTFSQDKDVICIGEQVTFTLGDTTNISSYVWNFGDGTEVENINPVTHTYDFRPEGDATVVTLTLKSDDTGCDATVEAPLALANVIADIEDLGQLCRGELRVNNNSIGASTYNWNFGDGTSSTEALPIKVFQDAGTYDIILTVSDGNCEAQDTITIMVDEEAGIGLQMPNLFTPNGNSQNDYFGPIIVNGSEQEEITVTTFRIYNRYGELVFDNTDPLGWNGIFNAEGAPPEVYAYYIEIDISGCSKITRKGNVTLMR